MSLVEATSSLVMAKFHPERWHHYHDALLVKSIDEKTFYRALSHSHLNDQGFEQAMHQPSVRKALMAGLSLLQRYPAPNQPNNTVSVPLILIYPSGHPQQAKVFHGEVTQEALASAIKETLYDDHYQP